MKNSFIVVLLLLFFTGCGNPNYNSMFQSKHCSSFKEWQQEVNTDISNLQSKVSQMQKMDLVTGITNFSDSCYVFKLKKGNSVAINLNERGKKANSTLKNGYIVLEPKNIDHSVKIPCYDSTLLIVDILKPGSLKNLLSDTQMKTVLSLKLIGRINNEDMMTINRMAVLENIDLSGCKSEDALFFLNPYHTVAANKTLRNVILPRINRKCVIGPCLNIENITISCDSTYIDDNYRFCDNLDSLIYSEGVTFTKNEFDGAFKVVVYPKSLKTISSFALMDKDANYSTNTVTFICKAEVPPTLTAGKFRDYSGYQSIKNLNYTLKVPAASIPLYQKAIGWKDFRTIKSIE